MNNFISCNYLFGVKIMKVNYSQTHMTCHPTECISELCARQYSLKYIECPKMFISYIFAFDI